MEQPAVLFHSHGENETIPSSHGHSMAAWWTLSKRQHMVYSSCNVNIMITDSFTLCECYHCEYIVMMVNLVSQSSRQNVSLDKVCKCKPNYYYDYACACAT